MKPPPPVTAPLKVVVFAATEKVFAVPVKLTGLLSEMPALVLTCVALLPTLLFSVRVPAAVRLDNAVRSNVTVDAPVGVSEIVSAAAPNALAEVVATSVPTLMVVPPV